MLLSYCIQHHPSRASLLKRIDLPEAEVVTDPDPGAVPSPWRTYRRCLELTPPDATHRVILQDDVLLAEPFTELVEAVVQARPDNPICLFVAPQFIRGADAVRHAVANGQVVARLPKHHYVPVVATVWPVQIARAILEWVDSRRQGPRWRADDAVVGGAISNLGVEAWASAPSLVEHPDDVESLMGWRRRGTPGRMAAVPHPSILRPSVVTG